MVDVIALSLTPGQAFLDRLVSAWDRSAVVAPLDPRLPPPALRAALETIRPHLWVAPDGTELAQDGGIGADEGDALVMTTSGSTGRPKAVVLDHQALSAAAWASSGRLGVDPGSDRWLACLPFAHVGGLSVLTRSLITNTPVVIQPGFDPTSVLQAHKQGATLVSLVATALARMGPVPFRKILLGGAAAPDGVDANVVATYGMTETAGGVVYDGIPLDGVEMAIDGDGVILLRGPMIAKHFRDGTEVVDPKGWLRTGDGGEIGPDGKLVVHGRMDDAINTGGEKVWPNTVEAVLGGHPKIAEVAVAGRQDPTWGERVVAFVVPRNAADPPTLAEIKDVVTAALPPWAAPKELVVVDSLPRTPLGKLRRFELTGP